MCYLKVVLFECVHISGVVSQCILAWRYQYKCDSTIQPTSPINFCFVVVFEGEKDALDPFC